ncbi:hypothetical protein FQN55_005610, partial [Onygenales sp. PD_40]
MARYYLAIPATSAPSESIFSQGSDIVTKKRNNLKKDTVNIILCLKNWKVFKDIKDIDEEEEDSDLEEEKSVQNTNISTQIDLISQLTSEI